MKFKALFILIAALMTTLNSEGEGFISAHNRLPNTVPITVNARVMRYLHSATNRPHTRLKMREMLQRMKVYQPMIERKLAAAGLPLELAAIPAVESMYRNTSSTASAGLWQLLPETARSLGLKVDEKTDERFNAEKETTAAVRYLKYIYNQSGRNWTLALLSYNAGETNVRKIVSESGVSDVFKLADTGRLRNAENTNYVSKVMAILIIMNNPSLVAN